MQPEPDRLVRPLRIIRHPGVRHGVVVTDLVDRAIDIENEPTAVRELELMSLESAASWEVCPLGLPARDLVVHRGLMSRAESDNTSQRGAVRSARQVALGRRTGEGADPGEQLALGDRTALFDLDPPLAAVFVVVNADVVREVLDDLAVTYQQQVVFDRQHFGDISQESPQVFIAMAFAARWPFSGWPSG
jgi:hypothetical protein